MSEEMSLLYDGLTVQYIQYSTVQCADTSMYVHTYIQDTLNCNEDDVRNQVRRNVQYGGSHP